MILTKTPEDNNHEDMSSFVVELLQAMAPQMLKTTLTDEEIAKQNEALKNKLQTQAEINKTQIVDNGVKVGISIVNDEISKRFSCG